VAGDFEFDVEFEEEILAACLKRPEFVKRAAGILDAHHFSTDQLGWIWRVIKDNWETHKECITPKIIINESRSEFPDDDEQAVALELGTKLFRLEPTDPNASLAALTEFVRFVQLQTAGEEMAKQMEKGNTDGAYEIMGKAIRKDAKPTGFERQDFIRHFARRLKTQKERRDHPELYPVIPTGFKKVDMLMDGGVRNQEFSMVMATTGKGKSIVCVHLGFHALKKIKAITVAHFSFEMHVSQVLMRYDARWSGNLHKNFKVFNFTDRELSSMVARLKKVRKGWIDRLQVVSAPVRSASLLDVRRQVQEMNDELEFPVGFVIMDSVDHLQPERIYKDGGKRHEHGDLYWGAKAWAEEDDIPIWSSTQAKASAADRIARSEDAGEAYEKSRIASNILSLNSPSNKNRSTPKVEIGEDDDAEDDREVVIKKASQLSMLLTKQRDGECNVHIPLDTDLARMLIKDGADKDD
jgi:replicative DNA helicase